MALEFLDRLRPAQFTSPSGEIHSFKIDVLEWQGGKKASTHEILNTNTAILQDQGNTVRTYPMEIYFTDGNHDIEALAFLESLEEKYTSSNPGILNHPRWGNINVMPFTWRAIEQLVNGAGLTRITVEFRQLPGADFPQPAGVNESQISADITTLFSTIEAAAAAIDTTTSGLYASFSAKVKSITKKIDDFIGPIASTVDSIEQTFNTIKSDIDSALSAGDDAVQIISQIGQLIRLPGEIVDSTINKVTSFFTMTELIINGLLDDLGISTSTQEALNTASIIETVGSIAVACTAESALLSDFETREASGQAIDYIQDARETYLTAIGTASTDISGGIEETFSPDHNTESETAQISAGTYSILINRAFSLSAKQIVILKEASDALTLTYKYYGDISKLEYFLLTNRIVDNEFIEIPVGREIVIYV